MIITTGDEAVQLYLAGESAWDVLARCDPLRIQSGLRHHHHSKADAVQQGLWTHIPYAAKLDHTHALLSPLGAQAALIDCFQTGPNGVSVSAWVVWPGGRVQGFLIDDSVFERTTPSTPLGIREALRSQLVEVLTPGNGLGRTAASVCRVPSPDRVGMPRRILASEAGAELARALVVTQLCEVSGVPRRVGIKGLFQLEDTLSIESTGPYLHVLGQTHDNPLGLALLELDRQVMRSTLDFGSRAAEDVEGRLELAGEVIEERLQSFAKAIEAMPAEQQAALRGAGYPVARDVTQFRHCAPMIWRVEAILKEWQLASCPPAIELAPPAFEADRYRSKGAGTTQSHARLRP